MLRILLLALVVATAHTQQNPRPTRPPRLRSRRSPSPTNAPTPARIEVQQTAAPTALPSSVPTAAPSAVPSEAPSAVPTEQPTVLSTILQSQTAPLETRNATIEDVLRFETAIDEAFSLSPGTQVVLRFLFTNH
jgi:hypothetical protein